MRWQAEKGDARPMSKTRTQRGGARTWPTRKMRLSASSRCCSSPYRYRVTSLRTWRDEVREPDAPGTNQAGTLVIRRAERRTAEGRIGSPSPAARVPIHRANIHPRPRACFWMSVASASRSATASA